MTLLSKNSCFVKTGGRFFQILWSSHNILTLPAEINWDEETAAAQNPIVHTEKISFSDIPLVILALYSSEYNTAKYWSTPVTKFDRIKASQWIKKWGSFWSKWVQIGVQNGVYNGELAIIINHLFVTELATDSSLIILYLLLFCVVTIFLLQILRIRWRIFSGLSHWVNNAWQCSDTKESTDTYLFTQIILWQGMGKHP